MQNLKEFVNYTRKELDADGMHAVELNAKALGLRDEQMMEAAGIAVADFIKSNFPKAKSILFICGTGNNAGDGFVAARHLHDFNVTVALLSRKEQIKQGPAAVNFNALASMLSVKIIDNASADDIALQLKNCEIVVDAIFGTGFSGKLPQGITRIIELANKSAAKKIAIDVPSGFSSKGTTGLTFSADYTITFHKPKSGLLGFKHAGKVIVAEIGIPIEAELLTGPGDLFEASPIRGLFADKNANGRVLLVGGGKIYLGAVVAASIAALRTGAGYAVTYVPRHHAAAARRLSTNTIIKPMAGDRLSEADLPELKEELKKANALVIGMGLGTERESVRAAARLIEYMNSIGKPSVVDADAIPALKDARLKNPIAIVATPHDREFFRLTGMQLPKESAANMHERARYALSASKQLGICILLKGHNTVIASPERLKINMASSAVLAKMGTGDVLAGIIGAYEAMGAGAFESAAAGAYLHTKAGELLAMEKGYHILASDIIEQIPRIAKEFDRISSD
ncbi:MAG: NAD(P)H-hydrate dehydratase [Candidatus Micrarchaeaceae archaeon]